MNILLTGGLGFIGSHTCVQLLNDNHNIVILDDLSNSKLDVLDKIKYLSDREQIKFYQDSILNKQILETIFSENVIDIVIHFAGLKSVNESIREPIKYYNTNIFGTINLLEVMCKYNCDKLIFSSSATVYGKQKYPVNELCQIGINITNPYGQTKYMLEQILKDICVSNTNFKVICLRYFNPIGAHKSGLLGENPNDIPNNLMPIILRVVSGKNPKLLIYGNDYDTVDGTCIRDFIHVEDLAHGHILAVNKINVINGIVPINLGTGKGTSVMELINTFESVNNIKIKYEITNRREGDLDIVYADVSNAKLLLGFECNYNIIDCCLDSYKFIKNALNQ